MLCSKSLIPLMSCTRNPFTPFVETFSHSEALPWIKMDVLQIFKCSIQQITFFHFMASMVLSIMLHSAISKKKKIPCCQTKPFEGFQGKPWAHLSFYSSWLLSPNKCIFGLCSSFTIYNYLFNMKGLNCSFP